MRVSQSLIANMVRQGTDRAMRALVAAQRPVQEGTALPTPSTDLLAADRATVLAAFQAELTSHDRARATVTRDLAAIEIALDGMHGLVVEAQDLAIQMGSDTIDATTRQSSAIAAQRLLDQIAALANRRDAGGKYLFTGTAEDLPPLAADHSYQGNDAIRRVEVAPGVTVQATVSGREVFGANDDLIDVMRDLVSALDSGDAGAVRDTLDRLGLARERISGVRTDVGMRLGTLADLDEVSIGLSTAIQIEDGELRGVDLARVAPALQSAQTMLEAAITTSQQIMAQLGAAWFR